jgi:sterol desaturase/sphingolipid hydroxylase (fatty acid hydroxylase superfamily)
MSLGLFAVIGLVFIAFFTREVIAPASKASCDRRWLRMAGAVNNAQAIAALAVGLIFEDLIEATAILPLPSLSPPVAGALTFLVASFIAYWWHRLAHASPTLWRLVHQLHHSPSRVETLTAFYAHPLDSAIASTITCSVAYLVFGFNVYAVAWAILYVSIFNLYIHSDTSSPRWVGYIVQRPEMHRVHHQLEHHAQNYGLPIWDLLFGTWVNPKEYVDRCGFAGNRESLVHDMLVGRDVNEEVAERRHEGEA